MFSNVQWILAILFSFSDVKVVMFCSTIHVIIKVMNSSYMCFVLGNNSVVITSFTVVKLQMKSLLYSCFLDKIFQNGS